MNRSGHIVSYRGEDMTLTEAIRRSGSRYDVATVSARLKRGWPLALALHRPISSRYGLRQPQRPLHAGGSRR